VIEVVSCFDVASEADKTHILLTNEVFEAVHKVVDGTIDERVLRKDGPPNPFNALTNGQSVSVGIEDQTVSGNPTQNEILHATH
jgi:D-alanyl-D-alanine carboxypeptidase